MKEELSFEVVQDADGGYSAECLAESIFTQAETWEALRKNVSEAVRACYFDKKMLKAIRLHLVRDEALVPA